MALQDSQLARTSLVGPEASSPITETWCVQCLLPAVGQLDLPWLRLVVTITVTKKKTLFSRFRLGMGRP